MASVLCGLLLAHPAFARVFDSPLKLKVYARGSAEIPDRVLGFTPSRKGHPIRVPAHGVWYVRPVGPLNARRLEQLAHLMTRERIPGIDLSDHWELTNDSLSHLKSVAHLAMLDISRTKISDQGLAPLAACRHLGILIVPETITDAGLSHLKGLAELRELNLDQTRITDQGVGVLIHLANLENLDLSSTHVTDAGLAVLEKIPHIKRLMLGALITEASAPHLAALKSLNEIDISQTQIAEKGLAVLGTLPELRTVYLPRQVTDSALKGLAKSPSLRALDLTRTGITDTGVKYIAKIRTLEEVALSQTSIGNACLSSLAELPALRMLELSDTHVTSSGLAPLARLAKLEMLSLSWQTLSHEDLQGMAKLKQLKTIVLNGMPLPEATMAQLRQIGAPSPWDSIAGLERARLRKENKADSLAIGSPVLTPPKTALAVEMKAPAMVATWPEIRRGSVTTAAPVASKPTPDIRHAVTLKRGPNTAPQEEPLESLPTKPATIDATTRPVLDRMREAELKEGKGCALATSYGAPRSSSTSEGTKSAVGARPSAPMDVATRKSTEDTLLRTITLQSTPAHAGAFSGLSRMRQLRHTESLVSINSVSTEDKANIADQEDKPQNFLGEISVGSGRSH